MKVTLKALFATLLLSSVSASTLAHHSFAMFDQTQKVTIEGMVAEVQWTNPHVWIEVDVPQEDGSEIRWAVEFTSVVHLIRRGMTQDMIKAGDAVEFTMSPYADGRPGGRFFTVKMANGQYYCDVNGVAQRVCQENN